jgi:hypothetical protein
MSRHFRYPKYTYLKDNTYYFSRSVPVDLRCFYTKPRIVQSLKTNSLLRAKTASKVFASKLDDYWLGLRLKSIEVPAAHLLVADGNASSLPTIEESFANDTFNHVPSCGRVNSSKGSEGPSDFLRRSRDGRGLDYEIVRFCEYVQKYYAVKVKYGLSFNSNSKRPFQSCGVTSI